MFILQIKKAIHMQVLKGQVFEAARISIKSEHGGKFMFTDRPPLPPRR
jgi:hypothetical protein